MSGWLSLKKVGLLSAQDGALCVSNGLIYVLECTSSEPLGELVVFSLRYICASPFEEFDGFVQAAGTVRYLLYAYMVIDVFVVVDSRTFDLIDRSVYLIDSGEFVLGLYPVCSSAVVDHPSSGAQVSQSMEICRVLACEC